MSNTRSIFTLDMDPREALKAEMEARGLTQAEAARAMRTHQPNISRWLTGKAPTPPMAVLALIATRDSKAARKTAPPARRKGNGRKH